MGKLVDDYRAILAERFLRSQQRRIERYGTKSRARGRMIQAANVGRRAPEGWAKAMFQQMRMMPLFDNKKEKNLWRRYRQGRITRAAFKDAVRAMSREKTHKHEGHHHDH